AFLDACLDRTVQQIVLIDAPAVVGLEKRETDEAYLANVKLLIRAAIAQGLIDDQPVDPLAHIIFGALHEAAMLIAPGDDAAAAGQGPDRSPVRRPGRQVIRARGIPDRRGA